MALAVALAEQRFRFGAPAGNAKALWNDRAGIIVTLEDDDGAFGQGEASPLPGYSDHTLAACQEALGALDGRALDEISRCEGPAFDAALTGFLGGAPPEAQFAVETALLDLAARRLGVPLFRLLRDRWQILPRRADRVALAALLGPEPRGWPSQATDAVRAGYASVKAKIGARGVTDEELEQLAAVRALVGPSCAIRLDANGTLAPGRLAEYAPLEPEFVEEPYPREIPWDAVPATPIALDESLRVPGPPGDRPGVIAWVLKLGPLGGFARCLALAREAAARNVDVVVSHTFEGAVGFAAAIELALALGPARFAAGLAAHGGLPARALSPAYRGCAVVPHAAPGLGIERVPGSG